MIISKLIILAWVIFLLYWILNAFSNKSVAERPPLGARLAYGIPLVASVILLFEWQDLPALLNTLLLPPALASVWIGLVLVYLGLALALWARRTLGANWSGTVQYKEGHELITRGPYAYVRHPIYTALLTMILGTALTIGSAGAFLALLLAFLSFWIKWVQEEKIMTKHFPDAYPAYRDRVRALIPFVF